MDSHIRVYIEANWNALGCLPPVTYKVLISLVQRADSLGRCFPSAERIAQDCGCHVDSVWRALETLEQNRYIGYLRRNEQDIVTGRWLPNVYMVNPHFICIGLEQQESAMKLWTAIYSNHPMPLSDFSGTNQQQEPTPETNTSKPKTRNSSSNQRSPESDGAENAPQDKKSAGEKSKKAKSEKQKDKSESQNAETAKNQQAEGQQRSEKRGRSAANYKNRYDDPAPIPGPIPDALLETLASRVNALGVPIVQARGFIVAYGGEMVEQALLQVEAAKRKGRDFKNEGGFFRYMLQNNLAERLPEALKPKVDNPFYGLQWSDFSE